MADTEEPETSEAPEEETEEVSESDEMPQTAAENADLRAVLAHFIDGDLDDHLNEYVTYRRDGTPVYTPPETEVTETENPAPPPKPKTKRTRPPAPKNSSRDEPDYDKMSDEEFDTHLANLLSTSG